jgi:hypothetical protein
MWATAAVHCQPAARPAPPRTPRRGGKFASCSCLGRRFASCCCQGGQVRILPRSPMPTRPPPPQSGSWCGWPRVWALSSARAAPRHRYSSLASCCSKAMGHSAAWVMAQYGSCTRAFDTGPGAAPPRANILPAAGCWAVSTCGPSSKAAVMQAAEGGALCCAASAAQAGAGVVALLPRAAFLPPTPSRPPLNQRRTRDEVTLLPPVHPIPSDPLSPGTSQRPRASWASTWTHYGVARVRSTATGASGCSYPRRWDREGLARQPSVEHRWPHTPLAHCAAACGAASKPTGCCAVCTRPHA